MDLMTRRRSMMARVESGGVRLPAEYQEVEYIEGNGVQYINTGITINVLSALTTEWCLRLVPTATNEVQIFAGVEEAYKQIVDFENRLRQDWLGTKGLNAYFSQNIKTNEVNTIMQKDGLFWLNEEYAQINSTASAESFVYLFGKNKNGSPETKTLAKMRLYGFTAKTGPTKIADFVPCYRKLDTKPGLYDLVSKTFITNQGTGEFLVGPDIN